MAAKKMTALNFRPLFNFFYLCQYPSGPAGK